MSLDDALSQPKWRKTDDWCDVCLQSNGNLIPFPHGKSILGVGGYTNLK